MLRTRGEIEAKLDAAARELRRITASMKTLEHHGATGSSAYRSLRDALPTAQRRHNELAKELERLIGSSDRLRED